MVAKSLFLHIGGRKTEEAAIEKEHFSSQPQLGQLLDWWATIGWDHQSKRLEQQQIDVVFWFYHGIIWSKHVAALHLMENEGKFTPDQSLRP